MIASTLDHTLGNFVLEEPNRYVGVSQSARMDVARSGHPDTGTGRSFLPQAVVDPDEFSIQLDSNKLNVRRQQSRWAVSPNSA